MGASGRAIVSAFQDSANPQTRRGLFHFLNRGFQTNTASAPPVTASVSLVSRRGSSLGGGDLNAQDAGGRPCKAPARAPLRSCAASIPSRAAVSAVAGSPAFPAPPCCTSAPGSRIPFAGSHEFLLCEYHRRDFREYTPHAPSCTALRGSLNREQTAPMALSVSLKDGRNERIPDGQDRAHLHARG